MSREEEQQEVISKILDFLEESNLNMAEKIGMLGVLQFSLMYAALPDEE